MLSALEKRLYRILRKLLAHPQVLHGDEQGGYHSAKDAQFNLHFPANLARLALARGLMVSSGIAQIEASSASKTWLKRVQDKQPKDIGNDSPFAAQHWQLEAREIFEQNGDRAIVHANVCASPLLGLYRQTDSTGARFLSVEEFAAGEKLRQEYEGSFMGRMSASNWTGVRQGRCAARANAAAYDLPSSGMAARGRVMAALAAVGPVLDRVLFSTIIREQGLSVLEQDQHWPRRSAKIVIKIALARLAAHYGMV